MMEVISKTTSIQCINKWKLTTLSYFTELASRVKRLRGVTSFPISSRTCQTIISTVLLRVSMGIIRHRYDYLHMVILWVSGDRKFQFHKVPSLKLTGKYNTYWKVSFGYLFYNPRKLVVTCTCSERETI